MPLFIAIRKKPHETSVGSIYLFAQIVVGLTTARAAGADALAAFPDGVTNVGRERIAAFALQHELPTVSG